MPRFDLLDEYTTICVPVRMQKDLPERPADMRDEHDAQLMRAGYLLVASVCWFFHAVVAFVRRIARTGAPSLAIDRRALRE
jgi:hypothetical protein